MAGTDLGFTSQAMLSGSGKRVATVQLSPMADSLKHYRRSVAVILDRSDVYRLVALLERRATFQDAEYANTLAESLRAGIRDVEKDEER